MEPPYSSTLGISDEPSSLHASKLTSVKQRAYAWSEPSLTKGLSHVLYLFLALLLPLTVYSCNCSRIEL